MEWISQTGFGCAVFRRNDAMHIWHLRRSRLRAYVRFSVAQVRYAASSLLLFYYSEHSMESPGNSGAKDCGEMRDGPASGNFE